MSKVNCNDVEYVTVVLNKKHNLCEQIINRLPELRMNGDLVFVSLGNISDELKSLEEKIKELEG